MEQTVAESADGGGPKGRMPSRTNWRGRARGGNGRKETQKGVLIKARSLKDSDESAVPAESPLQPATLQFGSAEGK